MVKITELSALTTSAANDALAIVDTAGVVTKRITRANLLASAYPVGSLYFNGSVATNPNTLLGFGTWEAYGAGRVLVSFDGSQTEFNTIGKTGGAKTHTLTVSELPSHQHNGNTAGAGNHSHYSSVDGQNVFSAGSTNTTASVSGYHQITWGDSRTSVDGWHAHAFTTDGTGGNLAHNNLQPYITVYIWRRTA